MLPLAPLPLQPTILRYNDEEYRSLIKKEAGWSREETDYLMELCHRLELRWRWRAVVGEVEDLNVANVDLEPGVQPQEKGQKS